MSDPTNGNSSAPINNLEEQIRLRAYQLYVERGRNDGNDLEDWLRAEAELAARHGNTKAQVA